MTIEEELKQMSAEEYLSLKIGIHAKDARSAEILKNELHRELKNMVEKFQSHLKEKEAEIIKLQNIVNDIKTRGF